MNVDGIVGAGLHAGLAADAAAGVKVDDGILAHGQTGRWANLYARCIRTVIASQDMESPLGPGVNPFFEVLDPGLVDADGIGMLRLACNGAGVATDTAAVVDDESIGGVGAGSHGVEFTLGKPLRPTLQTFLTAIFSGCKFRSCQFLALRA